MVKPINSLSARFMISFTISLSCPRLSSFISRDLSARFMISFTIALSCPRLSSFISHDLSTRIMISLPRSRSPCYPSSPASRVAKRCPLPLWFSLPVNWQWIAFNFHLCCTERPHFRTNCRPVIVNNVTGAFDQNYFTAYECQEDPKGSIYLDRHAHHYADITSSTETIEAVIILIPLQDID